MALRSSADVFADLRSIISGGGAADGMAARRLALRATGFIADPVEGDRLHERLLAELELQIVMRGLGAAARDTAVDALRLADEIEAASRPV